MLSIIASSVPLTLLFLAALAVIVASPLVAWVVWNLRAFWLQRFSWRSLLGLLLSCGLTYLLAIIVFRGSTDLP